MTAVPFSHTNFVSNRFVKSANGRRLSPSSPNQIKCKIFGRGMRLGVHESRKQHHLKICKAWAQWFEEVVFGWASRFASDCMVHFELTSGGSCPWITRGHCNQSTSLGLQCPCVRMSRKRLSAAISAAYG